MNDETDALFPSRRPRRCPRARAAASGWTPRLVLRHMLPHDPLDLRSTCRLRRRALGAFVPLHRIVRRAFALAARGAVLPLEWHAPDRVDRIVDRAIQQLIEEQWTEQDRGLPDDPTSDGPFYRLVVRTTGVSPGCARRACVALNALPEETRRAYFAVRFDGKSMDWHVAEGNGQQRSTRRCLREAEAVLGALIAP